MIKRLTAVPMDIVPIMAIDNGFCSSDPISEENSNGTMAKMVVSEVMIIVNPEKPDVPLNKNDAFQKVQKRHVQEKR